MKSTNQSSFSIRVLPIRQTGVVLVMALVMLAVLTLIGVASMSSSTLEMKVAGNMQQHNTAFQAAQSRLAFAAADDPANPVDFLIAIDVNNPPWPVQTCNLSNGLDADGLAKPSCVDGADWVATADVKYMTCGKGFGSSLEAGKGFSYRVFEIIATGETLTGSSRSVQAAGIRYPVKGCGDEML